MKTFVSHREAGSSWYDEPFQRMRRDDRDELVPITADEWRAADWIDITSIDDPRGVHVFMDVTTATRGERR